MNKPTQSQDLTQKELTETNGGGILGGDDSRSTLSAITQGYLNVSHTDDDGQTESFNTDFGTGSLLDNRQDS